MILGNNKTSKQSLWESGRNNLELGLISDSREIMSKMPKIQMEISCFREPTLVVLCLVKSDFIGAIFWKKRIRSCSGTMAGVVSHRVWD